jgi:uncharacterized SAM-binding protein YcdF (DUF218 family)
VNGIVNFAKDALRVSDGALIIIVFALGTLLLYVRPRQGRRYLTIAALTLWWVSTPFGNTVLVTPLARGFHSIQRADEARGAGAIVVLGGGIRDLKVGAETLTYPHESTTLRLLEAVRMFRLLGSDLPVVAAGGFTSAGRRTPEASVMADFIERLGVPRERILVEGGSRNTHEQALRVTRLLRARGVNRFVLVTAPTHIWRSTIVFRAQEADVIPSSAALRPDDAAKRGFFSPNIDSLRLSDEAIYDYAGLAYYWWRGWLRAAPRD